MRRGNEKAWNKYAGIVQSNILKIRPDLSGKIEWYDIKHMFYTKVPAKDAAKKYLEILARI